MHIAASPTQPAARQAGVRQHHAVEAFAEHFQAAPGQQPERDRMPAATECAGQADRVDRPGADQFPAGPGRITLHQVAHHRGDQAAAADHGEHPADSTHSPSVGPAAAER